ncbi:MAG: cytochrome c [Cyclobacteriaceae bacterium]|nr:cytochrome c [Cyclobacteriaceae bacterium]
MVQNKINLLIASLMIGGMVFSCSGKKQPSGLRETQSQNNKPVSYEQAVEDWRNNKGVGPIIDIELDPVDQAMVARGNEVFENNCTACHLPYKEKIGPALVGITERRTPEWIMNMILNPEEMVKTDPICIGLLARYNAVMADQNLDEEEARAILEYFRTLKIDPQEDPS